MSDWPMETRWNTAVVPEMPPENASLPALLSWIVGPLPTRRYAPNRPPLWELLWDHVSVEPAAAGLNWLAGPVMTGTWLSVACATAATLNAAMTPAAPSASRVGGLSLNI